MSLHRVILSLFAFALTMALAQEVCLAQSETVIAPKETPADSIATIVIPASLFLNPMLLSPYGMNRLGMPSDGPVTRQMLEAQQRSFIVDILNPQISSAVKVETLPKWLTRTLFVAGLFLSPQFAVPQGYMAVNPSFPYILYKIPEGEPYYSIYSPDLIPQAIRAEYDEKTGTYKQVMNDWGEFMKKTQSWHLGGYNTAPVKFTPTTPVERAMQHLNP